MRMLLFAGCRPGSAGWRRRSGESGFPKCKVLHAVEVNQVLPTWKDIADGNLACAAVREDRFGFLVML